MIEINLLPQELKPKTGARYSFNLKELDPKKAIYLIPLVLGILMVIHFYLAVFAAVQGLRLGSLNRQWSKLEPQRKKLESFQKEYNISVADSQLLQQLTNQRVLWAEKLNSLSLDLPGGVWFNELSLADRAFNLKGSVISVAKTEVNLLNRFLENLKKDPVFLKDFIHLEIGYLNRRQIQSYEVMDFSLEGNLRAK